MCEGDRPRRAALQVYGIFVWYAARAHACPVLLERALVVWAIAVGYRPLVCMCRVCVVCARARIFMWALTSRCFSPPSLPTLRGSARHRHEEYVETAQGTMFAHTAGLFGASNITLVWLRPLPGCPLTRAALGAAHDHMLNVNVCRVCCLFCVHPWMCDGMRARGVAGHQDYRRTRHNHPRGFCKSEDRQALHLAATLSQKSSM